jgi:hypothetical protein
MSLIDVAVLIEGVGNALALAVIVSRVLPVLIRERVDELTPVFGVLAVWFASNVCYAMFYANRHKGWFGSFGYDTVWDSIVEGAQRGSMYGLPIVILLASYRLIRGGHDD